MATAIITGQQPDQYDSTASANPVLGTVVSFQTGEGNAGTVFVPQSRYTVANVRKMVAVAARILDEVGALQVNY